MEPRLASAGRENQPAFLDACPESRAVLGMWIVATMFVRIQSPTSLTSYVSLCKPASRGLHDRDSCSSRKPCESKYTMLLTSISRCVKSVNYWAATWTASAVSGNGEVQTPAKLTVDGRPGKQRLAGMCFCTLRALGRQSSRGQENKDGIMQCSNYVTTQRPGQITTQARDTRRRLGACRGRCQMEHR